ncbi:hypothetical protein ACFFK0_15895 [Paenibacillus chartarius]|uniref:Fascin domain-containing protein n=1 Tax=Paenibacillus chartarius TaxID=747481 RepID=A0ABV6DMP0_9BACL
MPLQIAFKTWDSKYYMTHESGGGNIIVANRTQRGPWETFWLYIHDPLNFIVFLKTHDQRFYVTAEGGGGQILVADRTELGPWELFRLEQLGNNRISLQAHNGQYVCFENGGNSIVVANRNVRGPWETINVELL